MWCRFDGNERLCNIRCVVLNYYDLGLLQVGLKSFVILVDYQDYMGSSLETWSLVDHFYTWTLIIWSVMWQWRHMVPCYGVEVPWRRRVAVAAIAHRSICNAWAQTRWTPNLGVMVACSRRRSCGSCRVMMMALIAPPLVRGGVVVRSTCPRAWGHNKGSTWSSDRE